MPLRFLHAPGAASFQNVLPGSLRALVLVCVAAFLLSPAASAQRHNGAQAAAASLADPALDRTLAETLAFDNHAHPVLPPPALATDRDFDALPVDNMELQTDPVALRPDFPPLADAWKALWGFSGKAPLDQAGQDRLEAARSRVRAAHGQDYDDWVLEKAKIGTMVANRVAMGPGIAPPHFLWVPYDDALLFPLNNAGLAAATPDRRQFFALEDRLRSRYLRDVGLGSMPRTLKGYLEQVVTPTLERQHAGGALAIKFEVAYLRGLDFDPVSRSDAENAYFQPAAGEVPDPVSYKRLQDFLFRYIAAECGRLGMAVHLHGMAGGGRYFSIAGVNPMLLEPVLNDPALKRTNFVLLHGGWPYVHEAGALLQKPNVYLDLSQQALMLPAHTLAGWLREWLETYPEKVLFATDAYPYSPAMGWEEAAWLASRNVRQALRVALSGMQHDGEITPARAAELARMVLRDNARALYRLSLPQTAP